ncbi:hypothetical protein [Paenibacillus macerans]|uniref:Uncharacterized protein n=1 Tax=Paenibacillus macerans TaxID=44252 RepID=A0A090Z8F7_PAEMA|nr:hypothetical protein [Paenibacillus macerans]KFN06505.1 hypothetical protein DJ90_4219 [Paenibacillus macerans]MBS5909054.1 hypothetical protein [Paenibacillus macerans]MCY7559462.1 hypothetical protein [Paenibacillus macerans]MEC0150640.1 hypothetical protein [Paenibacillus macerans]SUA85790.1 SH3 domain protein [Paenibacillus macerans]
MIRNRNRSLLLLILVPLAGELLFGGGKPAEAGYWNDFWSGVNELSQLPSEVSELKADYQNTLDKLDATQETLESFRRQNEELMARNRELAATVSALTEAQQIRDANARKIRVMAFAGLVLFAGYFVVLRLVRLALRR